MSEGIAVYREVEKGPALKFKPEREISNGGASESFAHARFATNGVSAVRNFRFYSDDRSMLMAGMGGREEIIRASAYSEVVRLLMTAFTLQLIAYHAAVLCVHDVDKPRNLAKSVTVK